MITILVDSNIILTNPFSFTITLWAKWLTGDLTSMRPLICTTTTSGFCLQSTTTGHLSVVYNNATYTSSSTVSEHTWYHITIRYDYTC